MSRPSMRIVPASVDRIPASASASSRCPLPDTPARPTISPRLIVRSTPHTSSAPRSPRTRSPSIASPPGLFAAGTRSRVDNSRPTISRTSSARFTSEVRRVPIVTPSRNTVTRSLISNTSCSLWEMKRRECPSAVIRLSVRKRSRTSRGVNTAVGSSRMIRLAPRSRTLSISTRCCSPTESCQTDASGFTARPYASERVRIRSPPDQDRGEFSERRGARGRYSERRSWSGPA